MTLTRLARLTRRPKYRRTHASRIGMTWKRNQNYRHGAHSKLRWSVESQVNQGMAMLPAVASRVARLGRWRTRWLTPGLDYLMDNHPQVWALDAPLEGRQGAKAWIYVPTRAIPQANAWIYVLRGLLTTLSRIEGLVLGWAMRRDGLNDRNGARRDTTVRPRPILGGAPLSPRLLQPRDISQAVAHIMTDLGRKNLRLT